MAATSGRESAAHDGSRVARTLPREQLEWEASNTGKLAQQVYRRGGPSWLPPP